MDGATGDASGVGERGATGGGAVDHPGCRAGGGAAGRPSSRVGGGTGEGVTGGTGRGGSGRQRACPGAQARGTSALVSQPALSGAAVAYGPQTQEEAAMDAVSHRLRGWTDRIEAFA